MVILPVQTQDPKTRGLRQGLKRRRIFSWLVQTQDPKTRGLRQPSCSWPGLSAGCSNPRPKNKGIKTRRIAAILSGGVQTQDPKTRGLRRRLKGCVCILADVQTQDPKTRGLRPLVAVAYFPLREVQTQDPKTRGLRQTPAFKVITAMMFKPKTQKQGD